MSSHPFDGVPTFALTDHSPRIVSRQTHSFQQKIFQF